MEESCRSTKDPLRHIINKVLSEVTDKIPTPLLDDLRKAFSKAEDKYKFSIYGGSPENLVKYMESEDFADLLSTAINLNIEWVMKEILEALADEYRLSCPKISKKALEVIEALEKKKVPKRKEELDIDNIYRKLKIMGYNPERTSENSIKFEELSVSVTLTAKEDMIEYVICKKGKAHTLEGFLTKLSKIMEI